MARPLAGHIDVTFVLLTFVSHASSGVEEPWRRDPWRGKLAATSSIVLLAEFDKLATSTQNGCKRAFELREQR
jgi:hypothetical protein